MVLRDQSVPFSWQAKSLSRAGTKERESPPRVLGHAGDKGSSPSERRSGVACHRAATPQRDPSLFRPLGESRRGARTRPGTRTENLSRTATNNSVPDGGLTVASRAVSLQLTLIGGKVAPGKREVFAVVLSENRSHRDFV